MHGVGRVNYWFVHDFDRWYGFARMLIRISIIIIFSRILPYFPKQLFYETIFDDYFYKETFRGIFQTLLDIYDEAFCENSEQFLVISRKKKKKKTPS